MSDKFIPTRLLHCVGFQHSVSILLLNSDKESRKIIIRKGLMDKKKFHSIIRYIILIAVFVAAFFLLRYFFSKDKTEIYTPPVSPVEVVLPEVREIDEGITLTGYIEPDSIIPVVPFVSGTIEEYSINAGDSVTEGDILATIDKRPYELQLRQAEAQVKALKASYDRVEALYKEGGASRQDYDTLSSQLEAAEAQLELASLQLSYADVTSPVSGTVLKSMMSEGSPASSETPLCVISDLDNLIVNLRLSEKYYSLIRSTENLRIRIYSDVQGLSSDGEVVSMEPIVDAVSKTFGIKVRLTSPDGFVPGMFIKADIIWKSGEYLSLPLEVRRLDGSAYAVGDDSSAEYIEMDSIAEDGEYFAIGEEYSGKKFIIRGQENILPGEKVNIIQSEE